MHSYSLFLKNILAFNWFVNGYAIVGYQVVMFRGGRWGVGRLFMFSIDVLNP